MTYYKEGKRYTENQLRKDYLPTLLPRNLRDVHWEDAGCQRLVERQMPVHNPETHRAVSQIEYINGVPTKTWTVTAIPQEEIDAKLAAQAEQAELKQDAETIKTNAALRALLKARPAQIENYIENNVTNLAEAKSTLTILAKAVSLLMQGQLRG